MIKIELSDDQAEWIFFRLRDISANERGLYQPFFPQEILEKLAASDHEEILPSLKF